MSLLIYCLLIDSALIDKFWDIFIKLMQVLRYFNRNGASVVNYFVSRYCVDGSVDFYGDIFGKKRDSSVSVFFDNA